MAYDLAILQGDTGLLDQSLANEAGESYLLSGIRKAAQAWLITFLNAIGSSRYRPSNGSSLITLVRTGKVASEAELRTAFFRADQETRDRLSESQNETTPPDEVLLPSRLDGLSIFGDRVTLAVTLFSQAGNFRVIEAPVKTVP